MDYFNVDGKDYGLRATKNKSTKSTHAKFAAAAKKVLKKPSKAGSAKTMQTSEDRPCDEWMKLSSYVNSKGSPCH